MHGMFKEISNILTQFKKLPPFKQICTYTFKLHVYFKKPEHIHNDFLHTYVYECTYVYIMKLQV